MSLRLHLPPNLAAAVGRNAVPIKLEWDASQAPDPALFPALALLQRWCATPKPPPFLQLSRAQLRELAGALGSAPVFVEGGRVGPWAHAALLREAPVAATIAPTPAQPKARAVPGTPAEVDGSEHFLSVVLPSREHPTHEAVLELVRSHGFILEPSNRRWWLRDRHKALGFMGSHLARLTGKYGARVTENFTRNTARIKPVGVEVAAELDGEVLTVSVGLRAGSADEATLRSALASNQTYVESSGTIYLIDPEAVKRVSAAQRALAGDLSAGGGARRLHRVPASRAGEVEDILAEASPGFEASDSWKERSRALRDLSGLVPAPAPAELTALLRPYQRLGAAWLWHLYRHRLGGVLADEMGLGKTPQALALLSAAKADAHAPSLVVCPASLVENWRREALRFTPGLRVFVHHGSRRLGSAQEAAAWDLVITSYGTLARDRERFGEIEFACVVGDEAQHIKNRKSQNAQALRSLRARARFLLTGTPVENSLDDLRSLFDFLMPGFLDRLPSGLRGDERAWHDERLKVRTAPYLLRRTKQSVAPELPEKIEQVLWCDLSGAQRALYQELQQAGERELMDLAASGASEGSMTFTALAQLLRLRQVCCDPRLVDPKRPDGDSAKLEVFRELLEEAIDDGHRILVFSQFTSLLALLKLELEAQGLAYCHLDGSMTPRARQAEVDRFQAGPEIPLFLISLKAGGSGLNLTGADTVIHFDPWWNPAAEAQATDRAHRIGQTRAVTSYKLICASSVEEKVLGLQAQKRELLKDVFEASDLASRSLSLTELKDLLAG